MPVPRSPMAKPTAKPTVKATIKAPTKKATSTPTTKLPTVAEYKQSAAYKTNSMSYKEYYDYFKNRIAAENAKKKK